VIQECPESKLLELIVRTLTTFGAAFFGAWFAFKFQGLAREKETRAKAVAAGNRAIFTLMRQWDLLYKIQQDEIEPMRSHPLKLVAMMPSLYLDYKGLNFDIDSLSFILETSHRQCLADLLEAEDRFKTAMMVFDKRSKLHSETIQPLLERARVIEGDSYTKKQLEDILGTRLFATLSRLTDDAIGHVDSAVVSIKETSDKLCSVLKQLYPKDKFINFEPK